MDEIKFITIIGEDRRACTLAQKCAQVGYKVIIYVKTEKGKIACLHEVSKNKELKTRIDIISEFELAIGKADLIINIFNPFPRRRKLSILASVFCTSNAVMMVEANKDAIEQISRIIINPERLLGTKIFYPFSITNKVEFIKSSATSKKTIDIFKGFFLNLNIKSKIIHYDKFGLTYNRFKFQLLLLKYILTKESLNIFFKHYRYILYKTIKKSFFNLYIISGLWFIKSLDRLLFRSNLKVNIGGGLFFRRHWRVLDLKSIWYSYPSVYIDYNFNLMSNKELPFKDNSVKFFYTSHTLEHIPQEYCQHILNEIYRSLKVNGAVRVVVPDFDIACEAYIKKDSTPFDYMHGENIHNKFLQFFASSLRYQISSEELEKNFNSMEKSEFADYYCETASREDQKRMLGGHINWWNYEKLESMLIKAGFNKIYRSESQKSRFKEMQGNTGKGKFDSTYPNISLFVEAIK